MRDHEDRDFGVCILKKREKRHFPINSHILGTKDQVGLLKHRGYLEESRYSERCYLIKFTLIHCYSEGPIFLLHRSNVR